MQGLQACDAALDQRDRQRSVVPRVVAGGGVVAEDPDAPLGHFDDVRVGVGRIRQHPVARLRCDVSEGSEEVRDGTRTKPTTRLALYSPGVRGDANMTKSLRFSGKRWRRSTRTQRPDGTVGCMDSPEVSAKVVKYCVTISAAQ